MFELNSLVKPMIDQVNGFMAWLVPGYEMPFLIVITLVIAFIVKRRYKMGKIFFIILTLLIYTSAKYFGVNG